MKDPHRDIEEDKETEGRNVNCISLGAKPLFCFGCFGSHFFTKPNVLENWEGWERALGGAYPG